MYILEYNFSTTAEKDSHIDICDKNKKNVPQLRNLIEFERENSEENRIQLS